MGADPRAREDGSVPPPEPVYPPEFQTPHVIRVLRVIEYEYDTIERWLEDRERWTHHASYRGMRMRSAVLSESIPT